MIDMKAVVNAMLWHAFKVWSIPVALWLGTVYYFASHQQVNLAEAILWAPLVLFVLFTSITSVNDQRMEAEQARKDADKDFERIISYPNRYIDKRRELVRDLLNIKYRLEDIGNLTLTAQLDREIQKLRVEIYEMDQKKIA